MLVHSINTTSIPGEADAVRLIATVSYDDDVDSEDYWFEVPQSYADDLSLSGNPWLLALLPLAMLSGEPLEIEAPVDRVLLAGALESARVWKYWRPDLYDVVVRAETADSYLGGEAKLCATFFSGGVDSYYSLVSHRDEANAYCIDDLICIWGFDVPLERNAAFAHMRDGLSRVAHEYGKNLIPVKTNLRKTRLERASNNGFGPFYHGYALGAVGLALEHRYRYVLVPSNGAGPDETAWGTHPITVPLLSSRSTRFIYDTPSSTRMGKLEALAACQSAWGNLRVCFKAEDFSNCGCCEKCRRTMLGLEILNARERFTTFRPEDFTLGDVPNLYMSSARGDRERYYREMHVIAQAGGRDSIAEAITRGFRRTRRYASWWPIRNRLWKLPVVWRLGQLLDRCFLGRMTL